MASGRLPPRERALYQTGFSAKYLADLGVDKRVCIMPQAFVYHIIATYSDGRPAAFTRTVGKGSVVILTTGVRSHVIGMTL